MNNFIRFLFCFIFFLSVASYTKPLIIKVFIKLNAERALVVCGKFNVSYWGVAGFGCKDNSLVKD
ncbi:hypothetical protein Rhein_0645 [Rheinheimera sp. A13L]|nr:hypothetical protein Rhein_0645 [Rheinheimera sp. A13L]